MANASSEYSIIKPGTHHHLRKRDKPLRTYGRRHAASESNAEPPSKKPRLVAAEKGLQQRPSAIIAAENERQRSKLSPSEPESQKEVPCTAGQSQANSRKGSIMSYFKPAPSRPQSPLSPPQPADAPISEKPISESISMTETRRRKPRLLKIRAIGVPNDSADMSGEEKENEHKGDMGGCISPSPSSTNKHDSRTRRSLVVGVVGRAEDLKSNGHLKSKSSSPVQTTLNISAQAAFSECKICDTVWNPLYPDDVKYHTKRHKAVLRARMKKVEDEL